MPRALVLSNGQTAVCLDDYGFVRDFYYPYVGLENHVLGKKHRIGIWVDGTFTWLDDGGWSISMGYKPQTMGSLIIGKHEQLKVSVVLEDVVYNEQDTFVREVSLYNHTEHPLQMRIFFGQEFMISENNKRNTAFYDPTHNAIVHYKGRRVFIVNGRTQDGRGIDDYTVGAFEFEGKEGSFRDAEDGELGKNAVEHGSADSVIRFSLNCPANSKVQLCYWIAAGKSLTDAYALNDTVLTKTPSAMVYSTEQFWQAWLNKRDHDVHMLTPEQKKMFDTSLFILRAHTDNRGSIIASADSDMMVWGKDDYSYMWPRDAAFIVSALDKAGFSEVTKPFFHFCKDVLHPDGYLHHRFRPDKSLGSTWHSNMKQSEWLKDGILQLPIQEDETASVLYALWKHYESTKDIEFIETLFKPMIEKMANFLVRFRDSETGLPLHSYDLWEEKIGISTYTCASVYGGLMAASNFAELLGKRNHMREYRDAAKLLHKATREHLFSTSLQSFVRIAYNHQGVIVHDETVDASSLFGLWYFGMMDHTDPLFVSTEEQVQKRLLNPTQLGGIIRYERDEYFRSTDLSNPWFITTMWEAQRILQRSFISDQDLQYVQSILQWVVDHQMQSGVLAEQLNPYTRASLSATPLVWSHAVYVETVLQYISKLEQIGLVIKKSDTAT